MLRSIGRWFKAFLYLITGQIDSARATLDANPNVIKAKFDAVIKNKTDSIHQYKNAVASLMAQRNQKTSKMAQLTEEIQKLEKLKAGAMAKVKSLQAENPDPDALKAHPDFLKCKAAFSDFSSTLKEKESRFADLEEDVKEAEDRINKHKVQLESLARDIEKLKSEASDTVADVIAANQEKEIADALSGIAQDNTAEDLANLREVRQKAKAQAEISQDMAGTDAAAQEADFMAYASSSAADEEFDALLGLSSPTKESEVATKSVKDTSAVLPE